MGTKIKMKLTKLTKVILSAALMAPAKSAKLAVSANVSLKEEIEGDEVFVYDSEDMSCSLGNEVLANADECCQSGVDNYDADLLAACITTTTEENELFTYERRMMMCIKSHD